MMQNSTTYKFLTTYAVNSRNSEDNKMSKDLKNVIKSNIVECCREHGFQRDVATLERSNWKEIARDHMHRIRTLENNWKVQPKAPVPRPR